MKYAEPPEVSHADADRVLSAALVHDPAPSEASAVLVGLALHDDDVMFVEDWCVRVAEASPDLALRGTAALCIGHLARRFRHVSEHAEALVRAMAGDPVILEANGQVVDAREDLDTFLPKR